MELQKNTFWIYLEYNIFIYTTAKKKPQNQSNEWPNIIVYF